MGVQPRKSRASNGRFVPAAIAPPATLAVAALGVAALGACSSGHETQVSETPSSPTGTHVPEAGAPEGGDAPPDDAPIAIDHLTTGRFVRAAHRAKDGGLVVVHEVPLHLKVDWGEPERSSVWLDAQGHERARREATPGRQLLDVAVHRASGDATLVEASADGYFLVRVDEHGTTRGETPLIDDAILTDLPPLPNESRSRIETMTHDTGRIAAHGERAFLRHADGASLGRRLLAHVDGRFVRRRFANARRSRARDHAERAPWRELRHVRTPRRALGRVGVRRRGELVRRRRAPRLDQRRQRRRGRKLPLRALRLS